MLSKVSLRATLIALCTMLSAAAHAMADTARQVDIPAGKLSEALLTLSKQYSADLVYRPEQILGVKTRGAHGLLTTEQAVTQLLKGTPLEVRTDPSGAMLIAPPSTAGAQGPDTSQAPRAPLREASGSSQEGKKNSSDGFRMAQVDQRTNSAPAAIENGISSQHGETDAQLQEIVVTAQKRTERLINVPQSVSVLSGDEIARLGAVQFSDYASTIPGLSFKTGGAGYNQISLRGVTTGTEASPTVGIYVDEVPFGSSTAFAFAARFALDMGLFDIDRIEVLRGPQGTLYGASAMGGLLKYVTNKPDMNTFGVDVQSGVSATKEGSINYNAAIVFNTPLIEDKAAVRASLFESHDGGYIDNVELRERNVNRSNVYGGRITLLLNPIDSLSINLSGFVQNISRAGEAAVDRDFNGRPLAGELAQQRGFSDTFDQHFRLLSGTLNYDLGWGKLTSITSYQTIRSAWIDDLSFEFVPFGLGPYSALADSIGWWAVSIRTRRPAIARPLSRKASRAPSFPMICWSLRCPRASRNMPRLATSHGT
jgi:outer membrane receptor protein involved in Fe transport